MNYKKDIDVWFYTGSGRNQFWPILEEVYKTELNTRKEKKELLRKLKIALADIIYKCERKKYSNLDVNLINITYAINSISIILKNNPVEKIFFSSRFVEDKFKRHFKDLIQKYPKIELITFPSPSPRYTAMSKDEKIKRFKEVLPQLT